jgi:hypothetical protein
MYLEISQDQQYYRKKLRGTYAIRILYYLMVNKNLKNNINILIKKQNYKEKYVSQNRINKATCVTPNPFK